MNESARRGEAGQALVVATLFLIALMGIASIAIDLGRFYAERRFLQNAADAAALAAANALVGGASASAAESASRVVLTADLTGDPTGTPPAQPSAVPLYAAGHAGVGTYLVEGILISASDVRVALRNTVAYTFGEVIGLHTAQIGAAAHAGFYGGLMPIAVRQFLNAPGPNKNPPAPCAGKQTDFLAVFATEETSCKGTDTDPSGRSDPSPGQAFSASSPDNDPDHHGSIITILGSGAQPPNTSAFRGLVALDIRDYATSNSQVYYNGVAIGTNPNVIKQKEAAYLASGGYPGPMLPISITPPQSASQVGIIDGTSAGVSIADLTQRYGLGDELLVAVYPGYTMAVPDFTIVTPAAITLSANGSNSNPGSFNVTCNKAFCDSAGTVTLSMLPDTLDTLNPLNVGASSITFSPNPAIPTLGNGVKVALGAINTSDAAPGGYVLWVRGEAGSPYLTVKQVPFVFQVGSVSKDFTLTPGSLSAANQGDTATTTVQVGLPAKNSPAFGGSVTLSLDNSTPTAPLPSGLGAVSFSPGATVTPSATASVTLSVSSGTVAPGTYTLWLRATGLNGSGQPVTHLAPVTLQVAAGSATGTQEYVDLTGYAVVRVAAIGSNSIDAYAITPVVADPNDTRLRRAQLARLLPW